MQFLAILAVVFIGSYGISRFFLGLSMLLGYQIKGLFPLAISIGCYYICKWLIFSVAFHRG